MWLIPSYLDSHKDLARHSALVAWLIAACTQTKAELNEELWRLMEELCTGGMNSRRAMTCVCQFLAEEG